MRCLHLGSSMVQSAMLLKAPNDLQLVYTQYMMGFLLFHPHPRDILMIGLGGGSLAKFVYHSLPLTRTIVVEINPEVVAVARSYFFCRVMTTVCRYGSPKEANTSRAIQRPQMS